MELTINLQLDCTDRVESLVNSLVSVFSTANTTKPATTSRRAKKEPVKVEDTPEKPVETPAPEAPLDVEPPKPVDDAEPVIPETPVKVEDKSVVNEITDEDLRAAIRDCKTRLLGADVNADLAKKKEVVAKLKNYMSTIGAETSRDIPQDKRAEFIEYCQIMVLADNSEAPY